MGTRIVSDVVDATGRRFSGVTQSFAEAARRISIDVVPSHVSVIQRRLVLEGLRRLVAKTPVRTGRAKGNWQVTIGASAEGVVDREDQSGSETIAAGSLAVSDVPPFSIVFLTNNVPYIVRLENGWSRRAPAGMLRPTVDELLAIFGGRSS